MKPAKETIRAEFHCHTACSRDSSNRLLPLLEAARQRGLGKLAITDHNCIACALRARELAHDLIVVGEEILTTGGELLGYFLEEEIPARLSPQETIARLRSQGAFIAVPHPLDRRRHGWRTEELLELLPQVDALEVFNARCLSNRLNWRALAFAQETGMPMLAGSDAHALVELGLASLEMKDFHNAEELRAALPQARLRGRLLSPLEHLKASAQIAGGKLLAGSERD